MIPYGFKHVCARVHVYTTDTEAQCPIYLNMQYPYLFAMHCATNERKKNKMQNITPSLYLSQITPFYKFSLTETRTRVKEQNVMHNFQLHAVSPVEYEVLFFNQRNSLSR